jgi:nucleoside-diphosphate-sugar epimerase
MLLATHPESLTQCGRSPGSPAWGPARLGAGEPGGQDAPPKGSLGPSLDGDGKARVVGRTVALVGALHPAARELALALEDDPTVERVVGLSRHEPPLLGPKFEFVQAGPGDPAFADALAGVDALVLFPLIDAGDRNEEGRRDRVVDGTRRSLEAAAGAATVVLWSSGVVYGAHPDNPVPISESQPTRPNPDFPAAGVLASSEQIALDAGAGPSGPSVVVLRGAGVWAPGWGTFLSRSLMAPAMLGVRGYDPPLQCLAPADAASALALATSGRLAGVYNVAPDDWVGAGAAARAAGRRRLEMPRRVALPTAERLWRAGMSAAAAGELNYQMHPWVLDNSRLSQAGWAPTRSSAEAFTEAGRQVPEGVLVGGVQVRRGDVYRGAAAGLALAAALAVARRQARASRSARPAARRGPTARRRPPGPM